MVSISAAATTAWPRIPCGNPVAEIGMSPRSPSRVRRDFLADEQRAVRTVERWVQAIVRGGWRFSDPAAVTQDIMLELVLLARSDRIPVNRDFQAFVRTVTRHSCVDAFRRDRIRATEPLEDRFFELPGKERDDPEARLLAHRQRERLRFLWQALAPTCRELIRWAHGEEISADIIAERLDISPGNARVRLHRCLERARTLYQEIFP